MSISRAVLTLWYVNCSDPAAVLRTEPKADRGFGRKYLSQLNPALPVTPIGQFPLNRSVSVDVAEFYIGGYRDVTVVQTIIMEEALTLSQLSPLLLRAIDATDIYAFATNEDEGYAGFAHWHSYELKRSLCCTATAFLEDIGLPEPFEGEYWAGEHSPENSGGITLPFVPQQLMEHAQNSWLGVEIGPNGPDLDVVGYAVDGRPEPKVDPTPSSPVSKAAAGAAATAGSAAAAGFASTAAKVEGDMENSTPEDEDAAGYDDYAAELSPVATAPAQRLRGEDAEPSLGEAAIDVAQRAGHLGARVGKRVALQVKQAALSLIKRNRR
ncbi:hypothetical protein G7Y31_03405 [Corynebacterium lizhenjunii]|uniref:Uncharacterized protein n=1 Tax=Corynebacterium lizhenjunii TaxID=2709394 RepID=A0A7T0PCH9_9CORY|nr:hypothetical protein [Corynebacterium lizhenjunii]QPK79757.1 hypothetical protein G7Y31_03405 [Corynebacterium lizhenjunii]